jgi:acyl-CoA reductase-like NAD-dependent aldehyde dehydrogenase
MPHSSSSPMPTSTWRWTEAITAKFATSGQDCLGANRFYIERPVYDDFCAASPSG